MKSLIVASVVLLTSGLSFADCNNPPPEPAPQFRIVRQAQAPVFYVPAPPPQVRFVPVQEAPRKVTYMVVEETSSPPVRFVPVQVAPTTRETTINRGPLGRVRSVKVVEK